MKIIYRGVVSMTVKKGHTRLFERTWHNGALEGLQEAFAKMLTNYSISGYFPKYIIGVAPDDSSTTPKINVTGLRLSKLSKNDTTPCAEFNALIPCENDVAINMLAYTYTLYSSQDVRLAQFKIDTSDFTQEQIEALNVTGLQINIRWKMYLAQDAEDTEDEE